MRGQPGILTTTRVDDPSGSGTWVSVWWKEPGLHAGQVANPIYLVSARGISKEELLRIAESLQPIIVED